MSHLRATGDGPAGLETSTVRTTDLDEATRLAISDVCSEAHDDDFFTTHFFTYLPPDGLHVLAHRGEELVGHAVVTERWLQPQGSPLLRTAYVDAVSTSPHHQRRGVGTGVMEHLARAIRDDFTIGCLETNFVAWYQRLGWETWRGPLAGRSDGGLIPTPEQTGVMILRLPATPDLDLDQLLTIEAHPAESGDLEGFD